MEKSNGTHYINCYNQETHKRELYEVPFDVSVYVKQLEMKIKYPDESKLFRLYPELENKDKHKSLLTIYRDEKYGGFDFGVNGSVAELDLKEMDKLRSMVTVAIGVMEDMWRREQERKIPLGSVKEEK